MDRIAELEQHAIKFRKKASAWRRKGKLAATNKDRVYAEGSVRACQTLAARAALIAYALRAASKAPRKAA